MPPGLFVEKIQRAGNDGGRPFSRFPGRFGREVGAGIAGNDEGHVRPKGRRSGLRGR